MLQAAVAARGRVTARHGRLLEGPPCLLGDACSCSRSRPRPWRQRLTPRCPPHRPRRIRRASRAARWETSRPTSWSATPPRIPSPARTWCWTSRGVQPPCVCTEGPPDPYSYDPVTRLVSKSTGGAGLASFPWRIGGGCPSGSIRLYVDGILFTSYALASPDQDGDGFAANLLNYEAAIFQAKLGTTDPTGDLDCDGDVDSADWVIFSNHNTHSCLGYVDAARRSTWGRI